MRAGLPKQAWLEEFIAKEKEINGVKDEEGEAALEASADGVPSSAAAAPAEPAAANEAAAAEGARRT